jgi:hypothetical protein
MLNNITNKMVTAFAVTIFLMACKTSTEVTPLKYEKFSYVIQNQKNAVSFKSLGLRKNSKYYFHKSYGKIIFSNRQKSVVNNYCNNNIITSLFLIKNLPDILEKNARTVTTEDGKKYLCYDIIEDIGGQKKMLKRYFSYQDRNYLFVVKEIKICRKNKSTEALKLSYDIDIESYADQEFKGLIL